MKSPEQARAEFDEALDLLIVRVHMIVWGLGKYLRLWK